MYTAFCYYQNLNVVSLFFISCYFKKECYPACSPIYETEIILIRKACGYGIASRYDTICLCLGYLVNILNVFAFHQRCPISPFSSLPPTGIVTYPTIVQPGILPRPSHL